MGGYIVITYFIGRHWLLLAPSKLQSSRFRSGPSTLAIFSGKKSDTEDITLDQYFSDFIVFGDLFPPLSIRVQPDLRAVGFVKRNALIYSIPATPPWLLTA